MRGVGGLLPEARGGPLVRYGVALATTATAVSSSLLLGFSIDADAFPLALAAIMVTAWYGGLGPGMLATGLGVSLSAAVSLSRAPSGADSPGSLASLGVFLVEALVICGLSAVLHASQGRARSLAIREHAARAEIEATARRLRDLQSVTDAALAPLHLEDLLRELIGRIRQALAGDTVVILLLTEDETHLAVRAAYGLEREVAEGVRVPIGRGIAGRIAARREPLVLDDLSSVEISSPILRAKGLRALLGVPLMVEGRVIGVVHVGALEPRTFGEDEIRLLRLVADRIAIAIDHARLFEGERRAREAAELAERRFRLLVDGVGDHALYMLDADGRVVNWNAGAERLKGYAADEVIGHHCRLFYTPEDVQRGVPDLVLARAAAEGRHEDQRWRIRKDGSRFWASLVVTAVRGADRRLEGFATLTHDLTERRGAAEVRARLFEQVISAQEAEQRRIARELHDETGQSLTSLLVGLRALEDAGTLEEARERAAELRRLTAQTLGEVGRLARGLRPTVLDELGQVAAVEHHAAEHGDSHGIAVDVQARGLDGVRLPWPIETALYRIVQEALTNVAKHAGARMVSVVIQRQRNRVQAIVADDGCGFDVEAVQKSQAWDRLGLHGMRERAALLDGAITIESTPGEGTTVYAWIPLAEEQDGSDSGLHRG